MKIYVGGVNAVGKSTILKETAIKIGIEYVHVTTMFLNYLGFEGDYEKLRALTQEQRNIKLDECMEVFLKEKSTQSFLADSHYLNIVRGETNMVSRPWIKDCDALILISAPMEDVWERIKSDSRDRALFPKDISETESKKILEEYMLKTREEFFRLATLYSVPHLEILNLKNQKDEAVLQLTNFLQNSPQLFSNSNF